MVCQLIAWWEAAPADCVSAAIWFASLVGWSNSLVKKDQMEVSSLSRGVCAPLLSFPLQDGVCLFHLPLSAIPSAPLAVCFPRHRESKPQGELMGLRTEEDGTSKRHPAMGRIGEAHRLHAKASSLPSGLSSRENLTNRPRRQTRWRQR